VNADEKSGETQWLSLELSRVREALPLRFLESQSLGLTFRDFRGGVHEYMSAILAVVLVLLPQLIHDITIYVAGIASFVYRVADHVTVRAIEGLTPCGARDWTPGLPSIVLGLQILLPPLWELLLPEVQNVLGSKSFVPIMHMCKLEPNIHVVWSVPRDARKAAVRLANRGACAMAIARALPELAANSQFFPSNTTPRWIGIEEGVTHCTQELRGALWEVHFSTDDWPGLLSPGRPYSELLAGSERQLVGYICAPSRFSVEAAELNAIPPESACNARGVALEAAPLLLAFLSGRYAAVADAGPPSSFEIRWGDRARSVIASQLIEYHTQAVQQSRKEKTLSGSFMPQLSAAACIVGRARTLSEPEVYFSIAQNASGLSGLGANTSFFYVLDTVGRSLGDFSRAFELLPPTALALVNDDEAWGEPTQCNMYRKCGVACFMQFHKLQNCLRLVETAEAARGKRFDWLLRLRPDTQWDAPIGDVANLDNNTVHFPHHKGIRKTILH